MARSKKKTESGNKQISSTQRQKTTIFESPSSSSLVSVQKKSISENLEKKLSEKRKRVTPAVTTPEDNGVKLLKRGCVMMPRILRRKKMGQKLTVSFNAKGEPYGDVAKEMQSYIGVLARTKAPIWHDSWKQVSKDTKCIIWECVQMTFVVPPTRRKIVLASACKKWREFKCRLTRKYVLPYRDQPEKLKFPPADYTFIEKSHWDMFVANRLGSEFMKIHENQAKRGQMNEYPHRMSRKGYANLENEWSQLHVEEPKIDRSKAWILARQDKGGNYKNDKVKEKADEIEKLKKKVSEGELVEEGLDDVLTMALGKPEHGGRVRGQGSHVKQSVYLNLPRQKKASTVDERIQGVKKFMAEETRHIIAERDAFWAGQIQKLMAELKTAKGLGNCDLNIVDKENGEDVNKADVVEVENREEVVEVENCEEVVEMENDANNVKLAALSGSCQLAVGSLSNIIACAAKGLGKNGSPNNAFQQRSCSSYPEFVRKSLTVEFDDEPFIGGNCVLNVVDKENGEDVDKADLVEVENREESFVIDIDKEVAEMDNDAKENGEDVDKADVVEVENCEEAVEVDINKEVVEMESDDNNVKLAALSGCEPTLHGVQVAKDNAKGSITHIIQGLGGQGEPVVPDSDPRHEQTEPGTGKMKKLNMPTPVMVNNSLDQEVEVAQLQNEFKDREIRAITVNELIRAANEKIAEADRVASRAENILEPYMKAQKSASRLRDKLDESLKRKASVELSDTLISPKRQKVRKGVPSRAPMF